MRGDIGDTKGKPEEELFLKQETIPGRLSFPLFFLSSLGNINLRYSSSSAVNKFAPTSAGFYDVFGNVWEWTEDHNDGFPVRSSSHPLSPPSLFTFLCLGFPKASSLFGFQ